ncbi:MAG: hypothetical protein ACYCSP_05560 [Acidobacteriaceae bacterium]
MKMNRPRSYALGIAAALISVASMQAQPQHLKLVSANAELTQGLNTKSSRQGQTVTAKLTANVTTAGSAGSMELPKGTMLMGTVEQVQPGNGNKSEISIVFNEARLKDGREIPIKATLLGAYPSASVYSSGGLGSYLPIQPRLIPSDEKVLQDPGALGNVTMKSAVQSDVSGTFLSKKNSIKLSRGTQLQLAIAPESSSSSGVSGS